MTPCRLSDERLRLWMIPVTDYGEENPLHFDYYGCPPDFYKIKFKSRGDSQLANRIVDLYNKVYDLDLLRVLTSLTHISQGRVDCQNHNGFGASWCRWHGEKIFRA